MENNLLSLPHVKCMLCEISTVPLIFIELAFLCFLLFVTISFYGASSVRLTRSSKLLYVLVRILRGIFFKAISDFKSPDDTHRVHICVYTCINNRLQIWGDYDWSVWLDSKSTARNTYISQYVHVRKSLIYSTSAQYWLWQEDITKDEFIHFRTESGTREKL